VRASEFDGEPQGHLDHAASGPGCLRGSRRYGGENGTRRPKALPMSEGGSGRRSLLGVWQTATIAGPGDAAVGGDHPRSICKRSNVRNSRVKSSNCRRGPGVNRSIVNTCTTLVRTMCPHGVDDRPGCPLSQSLRPSNGTVGQRMARPGVADIDEKPCTRRKAPHRSHNRPARAKHIAQGHTAGVYYHDGHRLDVRAVDGSFIPG